MTESPRRRVYSFDPPPSDTEPLVLEINGEDILCHPYMDGLELLALTAQLRAGVPNTQRADAMLEFLHESMLTDDDWKKFQTVIKISKVRIERLYDIVNDLTEEYSQVRPTGPVEPSSTGRSTTGSGSAAVSSSKGSAQRKRKPASSSRSR